MTVTHCEIAETVSVFKILFNTSAGEISDEVKRPVGAPEGVGVSVKAVLGGIGGIMQYHFSQQELDFFRETGEENEITGFCHARCQNIVDPTMRMAELSKGPNCVDYLRGQTKFRGLSPRFDSVERDIVWEVKFGN